MNHLAHSLSLRFTHPMKGLAMKTRHFFPALCMLALAIAAPSHANNVRSDTEKNIFGCYDTVIFNNSNTTLRGGRVDWRYDYADGSYNQGSTEVPAAIGPGQRVNVSTYGSFDMSRCKTTRYQFKVLNWRTY
jgi:hypothetical protein